MASWSGMSLISKISVPPVFDHNVSIKGITCLSLHTNTMREDPLLANDCK